MSAQSTATVWCEEDNHLAYEKYAFFNNWLDDKGEDAEELLSHLGLLNIGNPSKALFAGDLTAYDQALKTYVSRKRHDALGERIFEDHWFKKNLAHFQQLVAVLSGQSVVPFIGAGVSCSAGFPSWASHLLSQAKTAGVLDAEKRIKNGEYEKIIDEIILAHSEALFVQNVRDDFLRDPDRVDLVLDILRICNHVLVTTNYDRCIEEALYINGSPYAETVLATDTDNQALITALSNRKRAVLKLHGNINAPSNCMLSGIQYEQAYGKGGIDMSLPLPRKLRRIFEHASIFFIGCSLNRDRTLNVFEKVMEERGQADLPQHFAIVEAPENETEMVDRNSFLASIGITPIWYPTAEHSRVADLIQALKVDLGR